MKGIIFGTMHSFRDLQMILSEKEIGAPPTKRDTLDVPGGDGELDFTEFPGEPKYGNATHKFTFTTIQKDLLTQYSKVKNALHGKKMRIVLDADLAYFYMGRCEVDKFHDEHGIGKIIVTCDCEPYKYKMEQTTFTRTVAGTATIILTNSRKRAVPTITTTSDMTISFGGGTWTNRAGTFNIPELELVEGDNIVTVTGTGTIFFAWQNIASFHVGTMVAAESEPHGLNQRFLISKLSLKLHEPGKDKMTLGGVLDTFTTKTSKITASSGKNGRDGQDAVTLRIDSSRGTVFKNSEVSTVLNVVIFKGGKTITDAASMRAEFGSNAYLEWQWQRMGEATFGTILSTDSRISNEGFALSLAPNDVDTKVVFKCQLVIPE